jgi:hypothetical protein
MGVLLLVSVGATAVVLFVSAGWSGIAELVCALAVSRQVSPMSRM